MGVVFSEEQKKVIEARNRNILVAAAAGSGKTTVLVERIIGKICDEHDPVDIDRLLIVTFTKAAAASMRQKISDALEKKLIEEPKNEHLQRQAILLHNAQITTIDSFCLYVLQNNFNDIGLEPGFRVADEGEMRLLKEDIMERLLERKLSEEDNSQFTALADRFCKSADLNPLTDILYDVYQHALSYPFPLEWLRMHMDDYGGGMEYLNDVLTMVKRLLMGLITETEELIRIALSNGGPYMYEDNLKMDLEFLDGLMNTEDYEAMRNIILTYSFSRLSSKKDISVMDEKREIVKSGRDVIKKSLGKIKEDFFSFSPEFMEMADKENSLLLRELLQTVSEFHVEFMHEKQEKKLIDFSDMEHYALEILLKKGENGYEPTDTAREYRAHFEEIMIDEYQDSNLVQEWLLSAVSGESEGRYNRFMVGDVKQSIYKFRLACPQLFMEKYDTYVMDGKNRMRIDLSRNFRSRKEVLDCTNLVFSKIMGKDLGNVEYDDKNALYFGATYYEKTTEDIEENAKQEKADVSDYASKQRAILRKPSGMDGAELILVHRDPEGKSSKEDEAKAVALRIKELIREYYVVDEGTGELRPAAYKDIVILLRKTKQWDEIMKRTFEQFGIPARITTGEGYFSTTEIQNVLNLLHVLDNPKQDIPLYGVLHSDFCGFSDNELAMLAAAKKQQKLPYLYDAVRCVGKVAETHTKPKSDESDVNLGESDFKGSELNCGDLVDENLRKKCHSFCHFLNEYRDKVKYESIHVLLREIFDRTSYLVKMSAMPGGEQKKRNILMLLEKAEAYEKTSMRGLFSFIRYIEKLQKYKVEFGEAALNEDGINAVSIMSIHKSKGLEFPICIVAGLGSKFNKMDMQKPLICDTDYGIGFDYVDLHKRAKYPNLRNNLLKQKICEDNLGEELRVLYVAFTRAKEKLILMGMVKDNLSVTPCKGKLPLGARLKAASPMDLILPAAMDEPQILLREMGEEEFAGQEISDALWEENAKSELIAKLSENEFKEQVEALKEQLTDHYQHENLRDLYTKTSVSELKIADMQRAYQKENMEEPAFVMYSHGTPTGVKPLFLQEETKPGGSERGSAYHRVLELLPFKEVVDGLNQVQEEAAKTAVLWEYLNGFVTTGRMTVEELSLVQPKKMLAFLSSKTAGRMGAADKAGLLWKEQPFVLGIDATRLNPDFPGDEKVLIQGIIDVFFEEEGEIVLLDYKTDAVKKGEELIKRYKTQIDYYSEAITRITGRPVKEKLLYSFTLHELITVV